MPNPYSTDLRARVVSAYNNHEGSVRDLATRFMVAPSTVSCWVVRFNSSGSVNPLPHPGKKTYWQEPQKQALLALVQQHPDDTLSLLADKLQLILHRSFCHQTISAALKRVGWTRKKKDLHPTERDHPKILSERLTFSQGFEGINLADVVFFDEAGCHLAMTPTYAWAPKGKRASSSAPKNWGENITIAAGLSLSGIVAPLQLKGSMDGPHFTAYLEQFLLPEMKPGQYLIVDNLSVHKSVKARELCQKAGVWLMYLPPYSPDLNPIEKAWSKIKTILRKAKARTWEDFELALKEAMKAVTEEDARGWFRASGFLV